MAESSDVRELLLSPAKAHPRYQVRFIDGRAATVLDMDGEGPGVIVAWITTFFKPGQVLEVIHVV